ncbi:MAG: DUF3309 domain-containing protein [Limisphaerales bacterium]
MLGTILIVLLVLMLLGTLPTWPHSKNWGYYPSGGLGVASGYFDYSAFVGKNLGRRT